MKSCFAWVLLAVFLMAGGVKAADEIVFVDLQEVFKQFYKTQLAQDQMRQQHNDIKLELDEMEAEVEVLKTEIEELRTDSRNETLSEEIRANKRDLLEEKLVDLQKKEQEMIDFEKLRLEQLDAQNKRMTTKLFDEIHETVVNFSKMKGYAAVVDRSAQSRVGTDVVLFASAKFDITADLLAVLNEGHITAPEVDEADASAEE